MVLVNGVWAASKRKEGMEGMERIGVGKEIKVKFKQTSVHVSQNLIEYLD